MKSRPHVVILLLLAANLAIACKTTQTANNNQRNAIGNVAQSNSQPSNSSQSKPPQQPAKSTRGSIEVNSAPTGARVLLVSTDEGGAGEPQSKGLTPTTIPDLAPGKYTVDLEKSGYKSFQKEVTVKEGATAKVSAVLKKQ